MKNYIQTKEDLKEFLECESKNYSQKNKKERRN